MITNEYREEARREFKKLTDFKNFNKEIFDVYSSQCYKIFSYIYVINIFKNRAETKKYYTEGFNVPFTLLLESSYSLFANQERASLLLLRSSTESFLKYILLIEREWIKSNFDDETSFEDIDYRFSETRRKFVKDVSPYLNKKEYSKYYKELQRIQSYYDTLSGVVHSNGKTIPLSIFSYYSSLNESVIKENPKIFDTFIKTIETVFYLIFIMMRESLEKWDTYELRAILHIIFKKTKTIDKYISYVK